MGSVGQRGDIHFYWLLPSLFLLLFDGKCVFFWLNLQKFHPEIGVQGCTLPLPVCWDRLQDHPHEPARENSGPKKQIDTIFFKTID